MRGVPGEISSSSGGIPMSRLPMIGEHIDLYGICCEGCGHFQGRFQVRSVVRGPDVSLVLDPQEIQCEGPVKDGAFAALTLLWRRDLECWLTDCGAHEVVVHISGHYYGPTLAAA
jgi:hypothetical protein